MRRSRIKPLIGGSVVAGVAITLVALGTPTSHAQASRVGKAPDVIYAGFDFTTGQSVDDARQGELDPLEEISSAQQFGDAHFGTQALEHPEAAAAEMNRAVNTAARVKNSKKYSKEWVSRGPTKYYANNASKSGSLTAEGFESLAGRETALATTPQKPNLVWTGAADGGAWKSTNGGKRWRPMFDHEPVESIGALAIDPTNYNRVYVGTGEPNTNADAYFGDGVYRTTDGGKKWQRTALKGVVTIFHIEVATPSKGYPEGRVFAATNNGLWLSINRGRTFTNLELPTNAGHNGVYRKTAFGNYVTDVRVRPHHPSQVVTVVGWRAGTHPEPNGTPESVGNGFYESTESGKKGSFKFVVQNATTGLGVPANDASPYGGNDPIGRTSLAYSADGKYLWAVVEDAGLFDGDAAAGVTLPAEAKATVLNGVYVSTTANPSSWTPKGNVETFATAPGSALTVMAADAYGPGVQAWYDQWVTVDPKNDNTVLVGLEEVYEATANATSNTGLATWRTIARYWNTCALVSSVNCSDFPTGTFKGHTTHPDQHAVAFAPGKNGTEVVYTGSDGGVFKQTSHKTQFGYTGYDDSHWQYLNPGLVTTQPYYASMSSNGTIWAGLQDNGELRIAPHTKTANEVYGGDGFDTAAVPTSGAQGYEEYTYGALSVTTDKGLDWTSIAPSDAGSTTNLFTTPFVLDPRNSNHIVEVGRYIDESTAGVSTTSSDWHSSYDLGASKVANSPGVTGSGVNNIGTAVATYGAVSYVPFCGLCDPITAGDGHTKYFHNGLATNEHTNCKPAIGSSKCWRKAKIKGLPNRYITGVTFVPNHPKTVYVTLGGYLRRWEPYSRKGGSVYVSYNGGNRFHNITGNLPAVPANIPLLRDGQLFIGTDLGLYVSKPGTKKWAKVGRGLPDSSILDLRMNPNGSQLIIATHGRGIWTYPFGHKAEKIYQARGPQK